MLVPPLPLAQPALHGFTLKTVHKPRIPLLIPSASGEPGELAEFLPGVRVRELGWEEAQDKLAAENLDPEKEYSGPEVAKMIKKARLVRWPHQPHLPHLAIYAEDRRAAPYLRYILRMDDERGIAHCACGEWFLQSRSDQVYCSMAHREYYRVLRWREKVHKSEVHKSD